MGVVFLSRRNEAFYWAVLQSSFLGSRQLPAEIPFSCGMSICVKYPLEPSPSSHVNDKYIIKRFYSSLVTGGCVPHDGL